MASVPCLRLEINIGDHLPARGVGLLVQVVVSPRGVRVHEVRVRSVGSVAGVVLGECESGFEKVAARKVVLIFYRGDVGGLVILGIRKLRTLRRKKYVLVVKIVDQETGREDVAVG